MGTFVGHFKEKQKAIAKPTGMLETTQAPPSLTSALTLALKQKVEKRSGFAQKAIEYAEGMLKEYIQTLAKNIAELESKSINAQASITNAESILKTAEEKLSAAQDEQIK